MNTDETGLDGLKLDREAEEVVFQTRRRWRWGWLVALVLLGAGAAWLMRSRPVPVRVYVVTAVDPTEQRTLLNSSGYVTARRQATVSSKITGKIAEVRVEEGQRVKAGEVLARLDDVNARANLELATAQVAAAKAALEETRAELDVALRELERIRRLTANGVTTESDLDQAKGRVDVLQARLERQIREATVAERQQAVYAQQVEDTIIRAPFDGVVTTKDAQPGEMISPVSAGGGYTRTGICTLVDMNSLEIEVDVSESRLGRVREGQPVIARLDAYPEWEIPGHVIAIIPTADRQKATVKVRVGFEQLDPRILPEMAVRVAFLGPPPLGTDGRPAVFVPVTSVVRETDQDHVWVMAEGRAHRREVKLGPELDGEVAVLEGLQPGEKVIIQGLDRLREGIRVTEAGT
ncbi:MAG: efflux RND transporter periplasmic adaptor subunit [Verrucomicrobia bacterium]|nr:MAG: efflux RND transporter periplasmic adaptor subunit [Verrucomicrobiota bacterium]